MSTSTTTEPRLCGWTRSDFTCTVPVNADGHHLGDHTDETSKRTGHNYGPVDYYQITWQTGHIETVPAHQVQLPHSGLVMFASGPFGTRPEQGPPRVRIHAEIDGRWTLTLSAMEEDIRTMRLVTHGEPTPAA